MEHEQTIPEQRKEAEKAPEPGTPDAPSAATPEAAPGAWTDAAPEAAPAAVRRRGGRALLLIAGAAVLGVLAGTVTGYAIQYDREPTPLAPLAQQDPVSPKALAPDGATTNETINANRWHKTDGDLATLLIDAPGGAKVVGKGYDTIDSVATGFEEPDRMLRNLVKTDVRRLASVSWTEGDSTFVTVQLLQFKDRDGADDYQAGQSSYMPQKKYAGNEGVAIPGLASDLGHVWVDSEAEEKPGYLPMRAGRAIARRGDIVLDIHYVNNRGKVAQGDVLNLAKRQLERL
ncbi:hypothetical protein OTB20_15005 [Streptomyces sp. H27-H1]|uniref:hypothetical protein n=1 Tax=Streptomyces sp. H27-H1 TaxID=2996461 RepID=UPI00226F05DE|nr:hypothetical protein [Streptomyces sp. H27-H1]MCY0927495.1 hypothetical protein [Streptomyces sp. H27-H1]